MARGGLLVTPERLMMCLLLASAASVHAADDVKPAQAGPERDASSDEPSHVEASPIEEIVVTSSRAALPGFSASTPTTVVGSDAIERESAPNIAQILNEIPGFKATQSPASNGVKTG